MIVFKVIGHIWRVIVTGFSFTCFGLGGLFLTFIVYPIICLVSKNNENKKYMMRKTISLGFKIFMYFLHFAGILRFKTKWIEKLKTEKSCLLIANHPTLIDVVSIIAFTPNACCIVKKSLWENIFVKGVVQAAGYIPNEKSDQFIHNCDRALQNGDILIIFPEGTRTKEGEEPVFQRGAAHLALMLNATVRCVLLSCHPIMLTKNRPWYKVASRRADFTLEIGEKINPSELVDPSIPRSKAARILTRAFLQKYCSNKGPMII